MIVGVTHNNDGDIHSITKYRGKISTGFGPKEGPNKENHPVAAGFFRMLKETTVTRRIGASQQPVTVKEWVINQDVQKKLEESMGNQTPRRIEIVCLHKTIEEMWDSHLAMYSSTEGLICRSNGKGTVARFLTFDKSGERLWVDREFNGVKGCPFEDCPDYQAGKCKAAGLLKCFPAIDLAPNPYRFETRSINTIIGIESTLNELKSLLMSAHAVKQYEAKKDLPFDGFFGAKLYLVHRKIKSGGRQVYITDIVPTQEFTTMVMEPIKRGLLKKTELAMIPGSGDALTMIESKPGDEIIDDNFIMDIDDQKAIAINFGADAAADDAAVSESITEDVPKNDVSNSAANEAAVKLFDK